MLEEWEKTGPSILKSLAGIAARLMITLFSHSSTSDCPDLSKRIQSRDPPVFFLALLKTPAQDPELGGAGGDETVASSIAREGGGGGWDSGSVVISAAFLSRRRLLIRRNEKGPFPIMDQPILFLSLRIQKKERKAIQNPNFLSETNNRITLPRVPRLGREVGMIEGGFHRCRRRLPPPLLLLLP